MVSIISICTTFGQQYLILGFLCISGEKGGIWKLCGDLKKEIGGELSLNVATFQRSDVATFQRSDVATFQRSDVATLRSYDVQLHQPTSRRSNVGTRSTRIF